MRQELLKMEESNTASPKKAKILWLASWYPNPNEPVNGDFIQRHAKAVSAYITLDVIHVVQSGKDSVAKNEFIQNRTGDLQELIYSFSFKKSGIKWLDKILYNIRFQKFYFGILKQYEKNFGRPDLLHVHVPMKAGLAALRVKNIWKVPYIVSEQASLYETAAKDSFNRRSFFFRYNTRRIFQGAALVTNVSASVAIILQNLFKLKQVRVVPNLVNTDIFIPIPRPVPRLFRWLHVSSLAGQKNPEAMLDAFNQLNAVRQDWELVIVGPASQDLLQLPKKLGLSSRIIFTGEIPYEAVAKEMQKASAFVLFSKHENFPCVVVEALCMGLPVVASRTGGIHEAVDNTNGKLVGSGEVEALTAALGEVMDNYQQYHKMEIASEAKKKYSHIEIGKQFYAIYQEILGDSRL